MNKLITLIIIAVALTTGCKDEAIDYSGPDAEIYGQWKQTEYYCDPGNGSGTWKLTTETRLITISRDGTFSGGDLFPGVERYAIIDSTKIRLMPKTGPEFGIYGYKISGKKLDIYPQCIEGCGLRFVKQ